MVTIPLKTLESGFSIPVYGLGLWGIGGRREQDLSHDPESIEVIRQAISQGITHIDTAEAYGDGHAEEILGQAIEGMDRAKLLISTKVASSNQGYAGTKTALYKSLDRMKTSYVDLFLIHRLAEPGISNEDTMRAIDELYDEGLIKNIGVCNLTPKRLEKIQSFTKHKIVYNQVHYNVQYREAEAYGLPRHAIEKDYILAAWRPVQKGTLPASKLMSDMADKYGKTQTQIAINWLVSQKNVVTLSKTSSPNHLSENLGALNFTMEEDDIEKIRNDFPDQKMVSDAVPLDYNSDIGVL